MELHTKSVIYILKKANSGELYVIDKNIMLLLAANTDDKIEGASL